MQISRETPPQSNIAPPPAGATPEAPLIWSPGDDPHEWLEHCETPRVAAWVAEQNAGTLHAYAHGAPFDTLLQRFVDEALSPDQLIVPTRHGDWAHDFRQDEAHPIGHLAPQPLGRLARGPAAMANAGRPRRAQ